MKIDFGPQLELEFPNVPAAEMLGKKEVSMVEVGKLLKTTRTKITKLLFDKKIFGYNNGRYLPFQKYIGQGFFRIDLVPSHIGNVPKLVVTVKGFYFIKEILKEDNGK